jgi:acetylornithine deacetylase/succinyl-diaminopimelate desuccinylase-like protein
MCGACDTKGSVAAMFTALLRVAGSDARPKETAIVFAGLVDEENGQEGSRALAQSRFGADLGIVGEPTELRVVTAHKGDMWLKLIARGKAAHGARPELGRNAVHAMAKAVDLLEDQYAESLKKRKHPLLGSPTINVGMIHGGTQPNIVPDRCEAQIDRRTIPGEKDAVVRKEILSFLKQNGVQLEIENTKNGGCVPMETPLSLPLVQEFMRIRQQSAPVGVDFFCDAAILSAGGIPCVVFGPGSIAQAHTEDEWISLRSLERATDVLTRFLRFLP